MSDYGDQAFGTQLLAIDLCFCGLVALRIACPGILERIEADADAGGHSLALSLLKLLVYIGGAHEIEDKRWQ